MEIEFILTLQDQDGQSHFQQAITVSDKTTIKELEKAINSYCFIHENYQELYHNEKRILSRKFTLSQIGVKDNDEIVIKHSCLEHWSAYLNRVKEFKNAQVSKTRKTSAERAQEFYDILLKSSFFTVYPKLSIAVTEHHKPISKYLDKHAYRIQNAAKNFFMLSMFKGQNPDIEFEDTSDGTCSAVICKVKVKSNIHKYRIKTNHNVGESGITNLDLIELYCYKLLEAIGVGPKIIFIPDCVASKPILYIGSEWLTHFQSFNATELVNTTEVLQAVVQIHLLASFLSLGDMHEENFGINASSDLIILDFMMSNYGDAKHKFLKENNIIRSIRARDILVDCDPSLKLQIAREAIRNWNLMDKLVEVLNLMNIEKKNFGLNNLDFDKKTRDLEEYVEQVRSNIQDLYHSTL